MKQLIAAQLSVLLVSVINFLIMIISCYFHAMIVEDWTYNSNTGIYVLLEVAIKVYYIIIAND